MYACTHTLLVVVIIQLLSVDCLPLNLICLRMSQKWKGISTHIDAQWEATYSTERTTILLTLVHQQCTDIRSEKNHQK